MKLLLIFASVVLAIHAASDKDLWLNFKKTHGKTYKSLREEKLRFKIFQDNLRKIEGHNVKYENGEETYFLKVTLFADKTQDEFKQIFLGNKFSKPKLETTIFEPSPNASVPDSIDWRTKGAVLEVKDQGSCGSCWAFSATGALEGQNYIKNNKKIPLSEQNLLDCSTAYGNGDCGEGGEMADAFHYVQDYGIESETDYPYRAVQGRCRFVERKSVLKVKEYKHIKSDSEAALKAALATIGPISVAIDASYLSLYGGGIFSEKNCSSTELDHGVLAVGYGSENNVDLWLVKNSWGEHWGEEGYLKMSRNARNQCGIATDPVYPVLA